MNKINRPLSPHLQVYRLPLAALLSISHRITGAGLSVGTLLVMTFFLSAASGEQSYNHVMSIAISPLGQIILFLWSAALYYHMCNGIRHLVWDTAHFMEKKDATRTSYLVIMGAIVLTAITWLCAFLNGAGL